MGIANQLQGALSYTNMIGFGLLLSLGLAHGLPQPAGILPYGSHGSPCIEEVTTIMVKKCHLEPDKVCSTESVKVGKKQTGHEEPICEEVKGCSGPAGSYHTPGSYGKRSAGLSSWDLLLELGLVLALGLTPT